MQISIWPTAIISENQTFDRSTLNFFKNTIFSACYYHCYLVQCVGGGVGGRLMFALAWQPVTNWILLAAWGGFSDSHMARNGFFSPVCHWLLIKKKVTHSWSNPFPFYLYFRGCLLGASPVSKFSSHPVKSAFFRSAVTSFGCSTHSLIIIKVNIYWILTIIPGTLQGFVYTLFLLILKETLGYGNYHHHPFLNRWGNWGRGPKACWRTESLEKWTPEVEGLTTAPPWLPSQVCGSSFCCRALGWVNQFMVKHKFFLPVRILQHILSQTFEAGKCKRINLYPYKSSDPGN